MSDKRILSLQYWRWSFAARWCAIICFAACLLTGSAVVQAWSDDASQAGASAPQLARSADPSGAVAPGYILGSGDKVHITVYGQAEMTGDYNVDGSGMLSFPLVGNVRVGGMTAEQASRAIEAKLSPDYIKNPHVSVEVLTYRPFYIVGEVKTPGSYPYVSGMTVLNAVALAGGFTYRAREDSFYITRNGTDGTKAKIDANSTAPVLPGDIITVRERYF